MTHQLMVLVYAVVPLIAAMRAFRHMQRRRVRAAINLMTTLIIGTVTATLATTIYAVSVDGHVDAGQFVLAIYFTVGVLLIINFLDIAVARLVRRIGRGAIPIAASALLRGLVLAGIGLPCIIAAAMTYRPRVMHVGDPISILRRPFEQVEFESTDGIALSGWWIGAPIDRRNPNRNTVFGTRTVLICHGFGADKATQLVVARRLIQAGYNVLAFDFRAHGSSGGRFTTLGDVERRDVLGAVHWLRAEHPKQTQHIVGLGIGSGAAALIGAAVDPSADGQAIEALAVYGPYDDLTLLADNVLNGGMMPVLDWLIPRIGLRLASLNAGANLAAFKPASLVSQLWPRPIFVIHGVFDHIVPFDRGRALFDAATYPKQYLWVPREDLEGTLRDDDVNRAVLDFFDTAKASPLI